MAEQGLPPDPRGGHCGPLRDKAAGSLLPVRCLDAQFQPFSIACGLIWDEVIYVIENFPLGMEWLRMISWSRTRCSPCCTVWQSSGEEIPGAIIACCVEIE